MAVEQKNKKAPALPKISKNIKPSLAVQIGRGLRPYLERDEKVQGIFENTMLDTQALVITTRRIISTKITSLQHDIRFIKELVVRDSSPIILQVSGGWRGKDFYNITSSDDNKNTVFAIVRSKDIDDIERFIQNITPSSSSRSIIDIQHNEAAAEMKQKAEDMKQQAELDEKQIDATVQQLQTWRANNGQCPNCGSDRLQAIYTTTNKGFDDTQACGGCCLFGPIGLMCGMCGSGREQEHSHRMCLNCGHKF